ncbi:Serine/threonine-protein kinase kin-29 [Caenorhabditis elegans]|uniref:Serine/threonine-protein kinase kin-29 n=1 Tax=Caenorhabditis elegans TaxID=6239 RepID=KIN29_CAEEL|nr:Serine/threonine-protein kinase kin-29 [Caenorhabditis elegans]Q21017.2 RecName: Full=Serine/threonine-protein kinase kin-29 [Caenorhabditis elegans]AAK97497.1 serine/threonine kinase KIN-29 [Caenorhabditis elegans]CCD71675.1 Serine/threonine-protein kinase kin-29 [Caenorhabditis elegans]|eukprot:NP_508493.1 Serine/threonine-protein kinase kin-29 [Caenorhabditis elegans]
MAAPRRRMGLEKIGLYDVGRAIGKGNFATVRIARHKIAKTKVAIKSIDVSALDRENLIKLEREVKIVKVIDHPHIVKSYEIMRVDNMLYIVSEYCSSGELYETLIEKGRVAENVARKWFSETASAVAYLHSQGIVHRDLKAENILLGKNSNIKIIDFGFSNFQTGDQLLNTWCGSPPYAAPELLLGNSYDGMKADIWSMGVLLYILVAGGFPFPSDSVNKLKRSVLSGLVKIPYWVSVECADFIRKMLVLNPGKRYTIQNVLQHRWMHIRDDVQKNQAAQLLEAIPSSSIEIRQQSTKLNPTIMMFMQQHGKWSEEQIIDAVLGRDFESPIFATYELLADKVKKGTLEGTGEEFPRRGSRGSILSGKANVDEQPLTPTISAHQLAQLNLSSPDCDSDDSSNSDLCDDSPMSSMGPMNHERQFGTPHGLDIIGNRFENRRHTLCASEQLLSPNMMGQFPPPNLLLNNFSMNPPLGFPPMPEGQAAEFPLPSLHPAFATIPIADLSKMLPVPKSERRASAGETLLPTNFDLTQHLANLPAPPISFPTVEEEGKSYLSKYGGKRNTVHCLGNQLGGGIQNPIPRYQRTPYTKAPPAERRSSWASPSLSAQQQNHLEKLFKQALQTNNDMTRLHKEFKGLSHGCAQSQITNEGSSLACPQISITDEYNRQHNIAPSASSFDPVSIFQKNAQEVVFGQRPATAIGFSSTSFSGMSTPEQTTRSIDDRVRSIVCTLPFTEVIDELKASLNILKIPFSESHEMVYEPQVTEMRRLSLPSGVEIGVAVLPPEHKAHVEFAIINNDSPTSEYLCDQLICRLRMIDPSWSSE